MHSQRRRRTLKKHLFYGDGPAENAFNQNTTPLFGGDLLESALHAKKHCVRQQRCGRPSTSFRWTIIALCLGTLVRVCWVRRYVITRTLGTVSISSVLKTFAPATTYTNDRPSRMQQEALDLPASLTVTLASQETPENDDTKLALIYSDARSGAGSLIQAMQQQTSSCSLHSNAMATVPQPWLDVNVQRCTVAHWMETMDRIHTSRETTCGDANDEPFCQVADEVNSSDSQVRKERIAHRFLQAVHDRDTLLIPCLADCNGDDPIVLQVSTSDWPTLAHVVPSDAKLRLIRLTRRNRLERYWSIVLAVHTNQWAIGSAADKRRQLEAFAALKSALDLSELSYTLKWDAAADRATHEQFENKDQLDRSILWVDHADWRHRPETVVKAVRHYMKSGSALDDLSMEPSSTTNWPTVQDILAAFENRDVVLEWLRVHGYGAWISKEYKSTYQPLQLFVLGERNGYEDFYPPGLDVIQVSSSFTLLNLLSEPQQPQQQPILIAHDIAVNPHAIQSVDNWFSALARARNFIHKLPESTITAMVLSPGAVEASITSRRDLSGGQSLFQKDHPLMIGCAGLFVNFLRDPNSTQPETASHEEGNNHWLLSESPRFEGVTEKMNCKRGGTTIKTSHTPGPIPLLVFSPLDSEIDHPCYTPPVRFPLWGDDNQDPNPIQVQPILDHVDRLLHKNVSLHDIDRHFFGNEILYVVNSTGVFGSPVYRDIYRVIPTEDLLLHVHELLINETNSRWPALRATLESKSDGNGENGFAYFAWYGDFKGCNERNTPDREASVPVMTTCATLGCNFSFPSPAYFTFTNAQPDAEHLLEVFHRFQQSYPWDKKIRQVLWRGSLSEHTPSKVLDSVRWRLAKTVHEWDDAVPAKAVMNVGFTGFPEFLTSQMELDDSKVGGFKPSLSSMNDFQRYTAILDMDGNSWSSRFSSLLCFNSLAIKVEPKYADYFFYNLVPWKHYVPIRNDLSDLAETIEFIMDPANDGLVQDMVAAANQWCMQHLTVDALARDQLDVWNAYVERLDGSSVPAHNENNLLHERMTKLPFPSV